LAAPAPRVPAMASSPSRTFDATNCKIDMISDEEIAELGSALADINRRYTAEDMRKILDYALEHRQMLGYPHDIAEVLEVFAKKLREFPQKLDPVVEHWKSEAKKSS
jgi:hypothetical protein